MKKNIYFFVLLISTTIFFFQCEEDERSPIYNDGVAPGQVIISEVKPTPGGAIIKYKLPTDDDLLFVEAKFTLENGRKMQVRSSIYVDSLNLEGFGSIGKFPVALYAVDRGGNRSDALTVDIETLIPPVKTIFSSVALIETFGGINVSWKNPGKAPISIIVMQRPDSLEGVVELEEFETIYSEGLEGSQSLRGFGSTGHRFAAVVRDRWDNLSDTLEASLTPLLEQELDKLNFKEIILPGDTPAVPRWNPSSNSTMPLLWDSNSVNRLVSPDGDMPDNYFYTFDLGVDTKLSRMKFWQFTQGNGTFLYFDAQYEEFEVWGAKALDPSGSFENWTKLRTCQVVKSSGLPLGRENFTVEDREIAFAGHDFEFPVESPEVRFIRIKVTKTFSNLTWASCGEMSFFGQINE